VPTDWPAKEKLEGEAPALGAVPVPESAIAWGLPEAESATVTAAVRIPVALGLKITLIAQLLPAARELPQLLVWVKSLAFEPESAMLEMLKAALPELVKVIACVALAVLTV
jgi:hypothetical protein